MNNNREFATTQWSVVRAVAEQDSAVAKSALQQLCQTYWYPLYSFVRFKGFDASSAEDLTQAFFADLLAREDIKKVEPQLGRFRSFLLAALKNFLHNQWEHQKAQKRGGGNVPLSLDYQFADQQYSNDVFDVQTPEAAYQRQWALTLLDRVKEQLRREFEKRGKGHLFNRLHVFMAGKNPESTMAEAASELDMAEVAVKVAVHRMRTRFGEILRAEILETVESPEEVDDEIKQLFSALQES